ncbi:hypothetical protein Bbelb_183440 [Branchiostoma belcheri]|nr:hypothetical protein Bbelb_183440 [Branchiostoma belcheri]
MGEGSSSWHEFPPQNEGFAGSAWAVPLSHLQNQSAPVLTMTHVGEQYHLENSRYYFTPELGLLVGVTSVQAENWEGEYYQLIRLHQIISLLLSKNVSKSTILYLHSGTHRENNNLLRFQKSKFGLTFPTDYNGTELGLPRFQLVSVGFS